MNREKRKKGQLLGFKSQIIHFKSLIFVLIANSSFLTWLMVEARALYLFFLGCYFSIGVLYKKCLLKLLSRSLKLLPLILKNWMGNITSRCDT